MLSGKEALWCVAALSECMVLLDGKYGRKVFDDVAKKGEQGGAVEEEGGEGERMSVDQMITWLGKARGWLMQSSSERGSVLRGKIEAALVKDELADGLAQGRSKRKGAVDRNLLGGGEGQMAEARA